MSKGGVSPLGLPPGFCPALSIREQNSRSDAHHAAFRSQKIYADRCWEMLNVLPSGSLNHATLPSPGDVQIPSSSCCMPG